MKEEADLRYEVPVCLSEHELLTGERESPWLCRLEGALYEPGRGHSHTPISRPNKIDSSKQMSISLCLRPGRRVYMKPAKSLATLLQYQFSKFDHIRSQLNLTNAISQSDHKSISGDSVATAFIAKPAGECVVTWEGFVT